LFVQIKFIFFQHKIHNEEKHPLQKPTVQLKISNGSLTSINITEGLEKTSIWKQLTENNKRENEQ
jgi:hypothetical protein